MSLMSYPEAPYPNDSINVYNNLFISPLNSKSLQGQTDRQTSNNKLLNLVKRRNYLPVIMRMFQNIDREKTHNLKKYFKVYYV